MSACCVEPLKKAVVMTHKSIMRLISTIMLVALVIAGGGRDSGMAQDKVLAEKPAPWVSSAFLGMTMTRGNSDTMLFSGSLKTSKKEHDDEWAFALAGVYGENNSVKNTEALNAFGQYNRFFDERLYGYLRVDGLYDGIADVDYRFAVSSGLGYYLIKDTNPSQTNTTLAVETGASIEAQRLGGLDQEFVTLRLAERFEHKINAHARFWQNVEVFPQVDQFENYVMNFEIGMEAAFSKSFSLKTCLDDSFANRPAANHLKNDVKIVAGIAYKF